MTNHRIEFESTKLSSRLWEGTAKVTEMVDGHRIVVAQAIVRDTTETKVWKQARKEAAGALARAS